MWHQSFGHCLLLFATCVELCRFWQNCGALSSCHLATSQLRTLRDSIQQMFQPHRKFPTEQPKKVRESTSSISIIYFAHKLNHKYTTAFTVVAPNNDEQYTVVKHLTSRRTIHLNPRKSLAMSSINPLLIVSGMYDEENLLHHFKQTTTVIAPTHYAASRGQTPRSALVLCLKLRFVACKLKWIEHLKIQNHTGHDTWNLQTRYGMQLDNYKLNSNTETYRRLLYTHRTHYAPQNNNKYQRS